jgi:RhtB (resistance to homoserine/threonine) family protein
MITYLPELLLVAAVHLLAVMSPGPDFAMICTQSVVHSRRAGLYASIGLALGILVHVTYSLIGIGLLISKSILLFSLVKYLGAGYLIWIGIKSLRSTSSTVTVCPLGATEVREMKPARAILQGFLTNVLNPKATLFFLALFTQVISVKTPLWVKTIYGAEMSLMTFVWFAAVAWILSASRVRKAFERHALYVERAFGTILVALGIKVALSNRT